MAKSSRSSSLCHFWWWRPPFSRWVSLTHAVGGFLRPDTWRLRACPDWRTGVRRFFYRKSYHNHWIKSLDFGSIFQEWIHQIDKLQHVSEANANLRLERHPLWSSLLQGQSEWASQQDYIYIKSNNNVSSTCIEIWYDKYHRIVSLLNLQISTGNLLVLAFSHESLLPYALFVVYGLMHQATLTKIPDSQSILDRFSAVSITDRSRIPTWFCLWFLHKNQCWFHHILEEI